MDRAGTWNERIPRSTSYSYIETEYVTTTSGREDKTASVTSSHHTAALYSSSSLRYTSYTENYITTGHSIPYYTAYRENTTAPYSEAIVTTAEVPVVALATGRANT